MKEVKIKGEIIPFATNLENTSLLTVQNQLALAGGNNVRVKIDCSGGDVNEGFAIYSELRRYATQYKARIITHIVGKCDSIATVIFLAGDDRVLSPNSKPYIHEPWLQASGNSKELRIAAQGAERASKRIAEFYSSHTNLSYNQAREMMTKGKFFSVQDCINYRLATKVENTLRPVALKKVESPMSVAIRQFMKSKAKAPRSWLDTKRKTNVSNSVAQIKDSKFKKVIDSIESRK